MSGAECPLSRNSDEDHDLATPLKGIGRPMPSCKGAKLMNGKAFKGSVGHKELAAWVDELKF